MEFIFQFFMKHWLYYETVILEKAVVINFFTFITSMLISGIR